MRDRIRDQRGLTLVDSLVGLVIVALISVLMVTLLGNLAILRKTASGFNIQGRAVPMAYRRAEAAIAAMGHPDEKAANERLAQLAGALSDETTAYHFEVTDISGNGYRLTITVTPKGLKSETYEEVIYAAPISNPSGEDSKQTGDHSD